MEIILGETNFMLDKPSAVSIGKFDGIHMGHCVLLDRIYKQKKNGMQSVVFTFDPAPSVFFSGKPQKLLTTKEEKREIFEKLGVDILVEYPLNTETAATSPEDFIREVLVKRMKMRYIAAGTDVSFGDKGSGNAELLRSYSRKMGYTADIIDKVYSQGEEVSSTLVRDYVSDGNMERTKELLGGPYSTEGRVVTGNKFGRKIGMPTMNIIPPCDKLLPPNGVYFTDLVLRGRKYHSITDVGCKPTVSDEDVKGVETYVYDFDDDAYGEDIRVDFLSFRRSEMKFASVDELKSQMQIDIAAGRAFHNEAL